MAKRGYRHTTPEQVAAILELYAKYKHVRPVADRLGLNAWRVSGALKRNGIHPPRGKSGVCARYHDLIEQRAREGASCLEIAKEIGSNDTQVGRYLRRHQMWRPEHRRLPETGNLKSRNTKGSSNPAWRGGRMVDKSGYVLLWMPDHPDSNNHGYVREHRLVVAAKLGRALRPGEVVDHVNGVTGDNRPENLRTFPSNGEHLRATLTGVPCPARGRRKKPTPAESESGAPESP